MRGQRSYFNLISEDKKESVESHTRGRNNDLLERRNYCMIYRYYYYAKIKKVRYDEILNNLSNEFFITKSTIIQAISKSDVLLKEVSKQMPNIQTLKVKYGFFNW